MKEERKKSRTLLRAKSSSSDALRVDGTDRVDVALIFRSLVATTLGTCNASFSGMNSERRGDLGGRGGGWTGSATSCPPVTCDSRGAAAACSDCICGAPEPSDQQEPSGSVRERLIRGRLASALLFESERPEGGLSVVVGLDRMTSSAVVAAIV